VRAGTVFGWDRSLLDAIGPPAGQGFAADALDVVISIGGEHWEPLPYLLIGAVAIGLLVARRVRDAALLVALVVASVLVIDVLQPRLERPPLREGDDLFPSGHATGSAAVFGTLAFAAWNTRWGWPLLLAGAAFVIVFGVSLVYFRAHYASDVLGGWCLGALLVLTAQGVTSNAPRIHGWMRQK
jgi:undecaprenyl-diphosphatase